jgi:glycerol-3-phosphate dehydrogenase
VFNATGPWVNQLLSGVKPSVPKIDVDLVQGTHIVVPGTMQKGIYYVEARSDRRAVFVMPWEDHTLVGTTETPYSGHPSQVRPLEHEIRYLLDTLAHYFPQRRVSQAQIIDAFAALRVLPRGKERPFARPRETILHKDRDRNPRLISVYGGKLTAYRSTAQKALSIVRTVLPQRRGISDTRRLKLEPVNESHRAGAETPQEATTERTSVESE